MLSEVDANSFRTRIESLLLEIECAPVECDGHSRMVAYLLNLHGIQCQVRCGRVRTPAGVIPLHFWVEVKGFIIDYRARMWLGKDAPHGVFPPSGERHYDGLNVNQPIISRPIFDTLRARAHKSIAATASPTI